MIKPLSEEHLDEVCRMEEENFSLPWHRDDFQDMIEDTKATYLVALWDNQVAAAAGLRNIVGEGEITNVVTDKKFRRQGIGRQLLTQLMEAGVEDGIEAFTLEVRVSNEAAIGLYRSLGFEIEGTRKNFYEKPVEDAFIMWRR